MSEAPQPESFRFRPHEHLRRSKDFARVYERKRSASDAWLVVYGRENGLPHLRLGLSVSKKKFPLATDRNRVRRLYREAFRLTRHLMPAGIDLILIPRSSREPTLDQVRASLGKLVAKLAKRLGAAP